MAKGKTQMTQLVLLYNVDRYSALFMYFPKTQLLLKPTINYSQSNKIIFAFYVYVKMALNGFYI